MKDDNPIEVALRSGLLSDNDKALEQLRVIASREFKEPATLEEAQIIIHAYRADLDAVLDGLEGMTWMAERLRSMAGRT